MTLTFRFAEGRMKPAKKRCRSTFQYGRQLLRCEGESGCEGYHTGFAKATPIGGVVYWAAKKTSASRTMRTD